MDLHKVFKWFLNILRDLFLLQFQHDFCGFSLELECKALLFTFIYTSLDCDEVLLPAYPLK